MPMHHQLTQNASSSAAKTPPDVAFFKLLQHMAKPVTFLIANSMVS